MEKRNRLAVTGVAIADCLGDDGIENNFNTNFFKNRVNKTKMVNNRSKLNQLAFHLSNPLTVYLRNIFLKKLVKNKSFLENYLGKIYR